MASEKMVVVQIRDSTVVLERERTSMCGKCPANMFCTGEAQRIRLEIEKGDFQLSVGDRVVVKTPATSGTKIAFLVYTMPTIIFVVLLVLAMNFFSEILSFTIAAAAVGLYYFFLKLYDRKFKKKFKPQIIQIDRD
ncbi:SoxR reducing system RseC family protein [Pseudothermotoga sp. U03pept]|uniref:SoxR reducing system RseC family protein n=1 Tax=Pseudothermotoga sp. U03pept TaxID=3447012 RepID=UPI003EFC1E22